MHLSRSSIYARCGGVEQTVATDDTGTPLRLYVFPGRRVYSVGGVITAVKP